MSTFLQIIDPYPEVVPLPRPDFDEYRKDPYIRAFLAEGVGGGYFTGYTYECDRFTLQIPIFPSIPYRSFTGSGVNFPQFNSIERSRLLDSIYEELHIPAPQYTFNASYYKAPNIPAPPYIFPRQYKDPGLTLEWESESDSRHEYGTYITHGDYTYRDGPWVRVSSYGDNFPSGYNNLKHSIDIITLYNKGIPRIEKYYLVWNIRRELLKIIEYNRLGYPSSVTVFNYGNIHKYAIVNPSVTSALISNDYDKWVDYRIETFGNTPGLIKFTDGIEVFRTNSIIDLKSANGDSSNHYDFKNNRGIVYWNESLDIQRYLKSLFGEQQIAGLILEYTGAPDYDRQLAIISKILPNDRVTRVLRNLIK